MRTATYTFSASPQSRYPSSLGGFHGYTDTYRPAPKREPIVATYTLKVVTSAYGSIFARPNLLA